MKGTFAQFLALSVCTFLGACSSSKNTLSGDADKHTGSPQSGDSLDTADYASSESAEKSSELSSLRSQKLIPQAFSGDGFPKIKRYMMGSGADAHLDHIEFDFNGDGRVDYIQWFDPTGSWVIKDAVDLDGNGTFDVTNHYKKPIGQEAPELTLQEFDTKVAGRVSLWKYYKNGELVRREMDRRGLGRPDYWEYYEGKRLARIERDENADGIPDSQPSFKQIVKPSGPEPGAKPDPKAR